MATYERCDKAVDEMAKVILREFETHAPVLNAKVKIDFVFAYANPDVTGDVALKLHGVQALGICKRISLKERALGRGDAEIALDGDWWREASVMEKRALLDHELHHIDVATKKGAFERDDLGRPVLFLRKHDFHFGWFNIIAARHGAASQECKQADMMLSQCGQLYWPKILKAAAVKA